MTIPVNTVHERRRNLEDFLVTHTNLSDVAITSRHMVEQIYEVADGETLEPEIRLLGAIMDSCMEKFMLTEVAKLTNLLNKVFTYELRLE